MHHLFKCLIFVWNNLNYTSPSFPQTIVPVHVYQSAKNSLNNRWFPFPETETNGIMIFDDDMMITMDEVESAFQVWKTHPSRIIGTSIRSYVWDKNLKQYRFVFSFSETDS